MPVGMTLLLKASGDALPAHFDGEWTCRFLEQMVSLAGLPEEGLLKSPAPFAVSFLMPVEGSRSKGGKKSGTTRQNARADRGGRFRLRLSWLADADLKGLFDWAKSLRDSPVRMETDGGPIVVEDAVVSSALTHRWNRWVPYGQLYEEATDCLRHVTLKFYTPTTLRRSALAYPLPDPCGIFLGYLGIWNAFSGISLAPGLGEAIEKNLLLVDFRLRRGLFADGRESMPGFIGSATFRLAGRHPESVLKGLNVLAEYAFFCGTGIGTGKGMGLTRRILDEEGRM